MKQIIIFVRISLITLIAFSAHFVRSDEATTGMDLSKRQLWHVNALVDRLVKKGELPEEIASKNKQRREAGKAELEKLKIGYMRIGVRMRHEMTKPGPDVIREEDFKELAAKHLDAVAQYSLHGFRELLALYNSLPDPVKAKLKAGDYDDLMPKKFVSKKSPSWMENGAATRAGLSEEQSNKWDAIHEAYLADLATFKAEKLDPANEKKEAALFHALFTGDEEAALAAYQSNYTLRIEPDLMKLRQFTGLYALLTDEQKAKIEEHRLATYEKQKANVEKFSFDKKKRAAP